MITIKAKQKLFTHAEVARLTGICAQHLNNFAKLRRLGFIARPNEAARIENEQRLLTTWDIIVLVLCIINVFTNKESCGILLHHAATACSCTPTESIATPGTDENH
jgi:hypothetical protein